MRWLLLPLLLLAACGAQPTPTMLGAQRFEAVRGGHSYVVYQRERKVEIIRLGYARRGEHQQIRATMIDLIQELTGCRLVASTLQGDSGEMRGLVNCPRGG
ncbi:hypothetical protein [Rhodobacter ferrooxidans]|uniref:Lipoprotein n=1 Tax=Rhodobacter ferrooxidans TaxID=371731 RepID=C8RZT8_9RHOB|nr:hypothetical protein [Rhodobacter sp. SW2]EEW25885.1 hypothetical protein Rsw2DRAFT_1316 [Rhodobacter sp. SW2]